jgi:hypothetical protein
MSEQKIQASPAARRLAKELEVDLESVAAFTGDRKIQPEDVERYYYADGDVAESKAALDEDEFFSLNEMQSEADFDNASFSRVLKAGSGPEEENEDAPESGGAPEKAASDTQPENAAKAETEEAGETEEADIQEAQALKKEDAPAVPETENELKAPLMPADEPEDDAQTTDIAEEKKTEALPVHEETQDPAAEWIAETDAGEKEEAAPQTTADMPAPETDAGWQGESLGALYAEHVGDEKDAQSEEAPYMNPMAGCMAVSFSVSKKALEQLFFARHIGYDKGLCETCVTVCGKTLESFGFPFFENKINVVMVSRDGRSIKKSVDIAQLNEAGSLKYDDYDPLSVVHVWILNGCALDSFAKIETGTLDIFVADREPRVKVDISCGAALMDMADLIRFAAEYKNNMRK